MMEEKKRNIIALSILNFGISAFWMVENFWINLYWTRNIDKHVFYVGLMVALSAVVGVVTQIIFGAISDSSKSKHGRMRTFILFGSITGGIAMCFFPITRLFSILLFAITYAIIMDASITFFGDITTPTRMAFVAENTEIEERGKYNAIIGIFGGLGIIMIVAFSGYVVYVAGPDLAFYMGGVSLIVCGIIFFLISKEPPIDPGEPRKHWKENIKETFTLDSYRENKSFYLLLLFLFVNMMGVQIVAPYLFIYIESVLGLTGLELAIVLAGLALMGFLLSFLMGFLLDKFGRKPIMALGAIGGSITALAFMYIPVNAETTLLYTFLLGGLMVGFGTGIAIASETCMQDLAPEDRRGSLLAYKIAAMVIPMVPGALIGGYIADFAPKPEGYLYSPLIFLVSAIIILISLPILKFLEETLTKD